MAGTQEEKWQDINSLFTECLRFARLQIIGFSHKQDRQDVCFNGVYIQVNGTK